MSNMTDPDALQPTVRTCQIMIGSMIMGVLSFLAIILFVITDALGNSALPVITYLAVAVGFVNLALSFVIPKLNADRARRRIALEGPTPITKGGPSEAKQAYPASDTAKLAQNYQTQLIIGAALLEGGAFFAAIAYMLARNPLALATAIVLLATLAALFPTSDRVNAWLDRQLELLQEERHSAS